MKKIIRKLVSVIISCSLVFGITACGGSGSGKEAADTAAVAAAADTGEKIIIRIAHDNSVTTPAQKAFEKFKEEVEEKSEGRIEVQIFPGGQMGSVQDTFEQCRRGEIEMSASTTSNFVQTIPEFAVWESFYMFDSLDHAKKVLEGEAGVKMMEPLEAHGLTGIGYMLMGFRNFSNSKHPINAVEDIKGLKMRGYNTLQIKAWESVGAVLTNVSWNELFTSLQQNLIDGQECATASFYTEKFYEAQKYWSLTQHVFTNFLWYANTKFMDSLSAEDRKIVMDAAKTAIDYDWKEIADAEADALEKIQSEAGVEVNEVSLEVRHALGDKMNAAVKDDIIANCGQEIYDMVFSACEEARTN
ncbi:TRAP transporter substrate-binding protein [Clostridium sp. AM58-1XD]|uniref:TRAP transporter substrate-binding protein n=1 Tax=Clostridium sp. AM58-1XD TaxID=2292307 RepID=UPI000E4B15C6|nr:TRAP transporter substrate-binding protein [Clostridium sp. AM58-1XD]RGY98282.1 TRAP transporter substrate-binding protein DctP [Clostridium sp. AM58-1XD]